MILAIETAGTALGIALADDDGIVLSLTSSMRNAHDALLARGIDALLQLGGIAPADLTAVAVSSGPGSFTGLRIGMAAAKGFALALGIPLVAVPTHDALAFAIARRGMHAAGDTLAVVFDARRGDVYHSRYLLDDASDRRDAASALTAPRLHVVREGLCRVDGPGARPSSELGAELPAGTWLAGDGAALVGEGFSGKFRIIKDGPDAMQADSVALLGRVMLVRGETADAATCEPLYVRDFHTTAAPPADPHTTTQRHTQ